MSNASMTSSRIRQLLTQRRYAQARELAEQQLAQDPEKSEWHVLLALGYLPVKNTSKAFDAVHAALRCDAQNAEAHCVLGQIYRRMNRSDDAIVANQKAVYLEPLVAWYHVQLGYAFYAAGRQDLALKCADKALQLNSQIASPFILKIDIYQYQLKRKLAVATAQQAIALFPENPYFHEVLGEDFFRKGKMDKASHSLEWAVTRRSHDPETQAIWAKMRRSQIPLVGWLLSYRRILGLSVGKWFGLCGILGGVLIFVGGMKDYSAGKLSSSLFIIGGLCLLLFFGYALVQAYVSVLVDIWLWCRDPRYKVALLKEHKHRAIFACVVLGSMWMGVIASLAGGWTGLAVALGIIGHIVFMIVMQYASRQGRE